MAIGIAILALSIVLYAALADRLGRWSVTMPMVFVVVGFVLGPGARHPPADLAEFGGSDKRR